jgi:hypothetical protein
MRRSLLIALLGALAAQLAGAAAARAAGPDVDAWGRVLARFRDGAGLDYAGLRAERADLDAFLGGLAAPLPPGWSKGERQAFWINAYNAVTVHHVLERYPGIRSVREVDGFFDALPFPVAGERLTLDEIETRARDLGDPRVHFAVVCASRSCPTLRAEPYRGTAVEEQLAEDTRRFLADPAKGLRLERAENVLWLSSIFKWYAGDFTGSSTLVAFFARGGVVEWLLPHLPPELAAEIRKSEPAVRYLDYDWALNDLAR